MTKRFKQNYNEKPIEQIVCSILMYLLEHPRAKKMDLTTHFNITWCKLTPFLKDMRTERLIYYPDNEKKLLQEISFAVTWDGVKFLIDNNQYSNILLQKLKIQS